MLKSINLSLSSACGANCIFCPSNRGQRIKEKIMPLEIAKKIIDEISSKNFKENHQVTNIEVGENGDALLNNNFINILQYIKKKLPDIRIELFTNFSNLNKQKTRIILEQNLIDSFQCNIDGHSPGNYYLAKKLDLNKTLENLNNFLSIRYKTNNKSRLTIYTITINNYIKTIQNNLHIFPTNLRESKTNKSIKDDFHLIEKKLYKLIDHKKDQIIKSPITGWAERESIDTKKIKYKTLTCPFINRVKHEAYFAPDGTWYACCLDSNNELSLGNIQNSSINDIYNCRKRKILIQKLQNKEFQSINGPCKTVNCCQIFN